MATDDAADHASSDSDREHTFLRARVRNRYRLLRKWTAAINAYDGPGDGIILDGYRPQGAAAVNVQEIAGLVVVDRDERFHNFRLYRDETAVFLRSTDTPKSWVAIDPLDKPPGDDTIYLTNGPPEAVTEILEALDITPRWSDACNDGAHDFDVESEGTKYEAIFCRKCEHPRYVLSWIGHAVPREL